jgi:type I restriction enzyme S subunit
MPFSIPANWVWTVLGVTGRIFNGNSVNDEEKSRLASVATGLPFIATRHVGYGQDPLDYNNGLTVPYDAPGYRVAEAGAVLICSEGGSAGRKMGVTDRPVCFGNKLYANVPWDGVHPQFLLAVYQSQWFYGEFRARMTGIIGGIAKRAFVTLPLPLPPALEQERIVAKVIELIGLCDLMEATQSQQESRRDSVRSVSLRSITGSEHDGHAVHLFMNAASRSVTRPEHVDEVRHAIRQLAVTGRLVPQDPTDEPVEELLMRLAAERRDRPRRQRPPRTMGGPIGESPLSWTTVTLEQLSASLDYGTSDKASRSGPGIPCLRMGNIQGGELRLHDLVYIDLDSVDERLLLQPGDLLFNRTNSAELVGKNALFTGADTPFTFASYLIRVRPLPSGDMRWVRIVLNSAGGRSYLESVRSQQTGQANINGTKLAATPIPLPPLAEQRRIVAKVDELMTVCGELERALTAEQHQRARLLEALLNDALAEPGTRLRATATGIAGRNPSSPPRQGVSPGAGRA